MSYFADKYKKHKEDKLDKDLDKQKQKIKDKREKNEYMLFGHVKSIFQTESNIQAASKYPVKIKILEREISKLSEPLIEYFDRAQLFMCVIPLGETLIAVYHKTGKLAHTEYVRRLIAEELKEIKQIVNREIPLLMKETTEAQSTAMNATFSKKKKRDIANELQEKLDQLNKIVLTIDEIVVKQNIENDRILAITESKQD